MPFARIASLIFAVVLLVGCAKEEEPVARDEVVTAFANEGVRLVQTGDPDFMTSPEAPTLIVSVFPDADTKEDHTPGGAEIIGYRNVLATWGPGRVAPAVEQQIEAAMMSLDED